MKTIIKQIIREKITTGEIQPSSIAVQSAISKISDSRVTDKDIVQAIKEVIRKGAI